MGWLSGGPPSKVSAVKEVDDSSSRPPLLEDLTPKFEDTEPQQRKPPSYGDALKKLSLSDFTIENYITMPCFREAMLTGFQAMGVLGVVTFFVHKSPRRSVNWGIGGFFLGSIVGWEQCRSIRRRSFQTVEAAKAANLEKNRRRTMKLEGEDDALKKFSEMQNRGSK